MMHSKEQVLSIIRETNTEHEPTLTVHFEELYAMDQTRFRLRIEFNSHVAVANDMLDGTPNLEGFIKFIRAQLDEELTKQIVLWASDRAIEERQ